MPSLRPVDTAVTSVASPCISVCQMDPHTRLCVGCARTIEEIAGWSSYTRVEKLAVWQRIIERRERG